MGSKLKIGLLLAGIFLCGAVAGGFITVGVIQRQTQQRHDPATWEPVAVRRLITQLQLTPDQQEKVRPIVQRTVQDLRQVRQGAARDTLIAFRRMERDLEPILTPEQRARYEELKQRMRERLQRWGVNRPDQAPALLPRPRATPPGSPPPAPPP